MADGNAVPRQQGAHPSCVDKNEWMASVLSDENLACCAKNVAVRIALHHNSKTGQCNPSIETLAKGTNLKTRAVHNAIAALRDAGFLTWNTPKGGSSTYRLQRITIGQDRNRADAASSVASDAPAPLHRDAGGSAGPLHGDAGGTCTGMQGDPCTGMHTNPGSSNPRNEPVSYSQRSGDAGRQTFASRSGSQSSPWFTTMPDGFVLDERRTGIAARNGVPRDQVRKAWDHFVAHNRSRGSTSADWDAAWLSWCIRRSTMPKAPEQRRAAI